MSMRTKTEKLDLKLLPREVGSLRTIKNHRLGLEMYLSDQRYRNRLLDRLKVKLLQAVVQLFSALSKFLLSLNESISLFKLVRRNLIVFSQAPIKTAQSRDKQTETQTRSLIKVQLDCSKRS